MFLLLLYHTYKLVYPVLTGKRNEVVPLDPDEVVSVGSLVFVEQADHVTHLMREPSLVLQTNPRN